MNKTSKNKSLRGRKLWIPRLSVDGASIFAAAYRALGINAEIVPESDAYSNELARKYTIGEECYPQVITLGSFLKVMERADFNPATTALMMPTTDGPCRFGQYMPLIEKVLADNHLDEVLVVSPSSSQGYDDIGFDSDNLYRLLWWAVVCADIIRKLLLQIRPFEICQGETDSVHQQAIAQLCAVMQKENQPIKEKLTELAQTVLTIRSAYERVEVDYSQDKPLIGVVGEIYCRFDGAANADLIRRIEKFGGEVWLSSVSEWVWYSNFYQQNELKMAGKGLSLDMLGTVVRNKFQRKDEHQLYASCLDRFIGYEEPEHIQILLELAEPYLPYQGVVGEMVLNIGGSIYMYGKGADGIVDISPFSCMNGIVSEAIYPAVSKDHEDIPIRIFYFDETESDYDRDVEIFLDLAKTYKARKNKQRIYPSHFHTEEAVKSAR
jgi:predicted nucleotide-binding protein (sugar kinase/HSP70/actin superfamily)